MICDHLNFVCNHLQLSAPDVAEFLKISDGTATSTTSAATACCAAPSPAVACGMAKMVTVVALGRKHQWNVKYMSHFRHLS